MSAQEDDILVRRFKNAAEEAFDRTYEKYAVAVYSIYYRYARNEADARDISQEVFEEMRMNVGRNTWTPDRRSRLPQLLAEILVPTLAVAALLLIILWPRNGTVEFNVPVAELIEDEEIAGLVFAGIVDDEMMEDFIIIENHLVSDYEEAIDELTPEEEEELVVALSRKFMPGI